MTSELDKARGALESFDATRDAYEDARTRDDRTYLLSMLDNHDAHDVDHLRAALAEVDRLTAALAAADANAADIICRMEAAIERGEHHPKETP